MAIPRDQTTTYVDTRRKAKDGLPQVLGVITQPALQAMGLPPVNLEEHWHPKRGLTMQEEVFCQALMLTNNTCEAWKIATGREKRSEANAILKRPLVQARIAELMMPAKTAEDVAKAYALRENRRLAESNIQHLFDEDGKFLPVKEWNDDIAAAVKAIKFKAMRASSDEEAVPCDLVEVTLWDKNIALERQFKHLNLIEPETAKVNITIADRLESARNRVRERYIDGEAERV